VSGQSVIAPDVLSRYAGDAAREVDGVVAGRRSLVSDVDGSLKVEVHVALEWGRSVADVGAEVQRRVAEYLERMTSSRVTAVDVVVTEVGAPPPK
jgi:uncharacterized alkaline shock family protein YloU